MPHRVSRTERVWLDPLSGDYETFVELVSRSTIPEDWPLADRIEKNAPIYNGDMIRTLDEEHRRDLMAEWVEVFSSGPGLIVIEGAFGDTAPIDRATTLFEEMIEKERQAGHSGADHFAKPGANDRVWNSLEKHCLADPESFALYYGNVAVAAVSEAWLGPGYQITAQVNRVNPGGQAQSAHRDYHLGFMTPDQITRYPAHVHTISPVLTLQGAVAHCDMPLESGPTLYLPFSQLHFEGYIAFARPEFQTYFTENYVQLPLKKGDAVFFNPALMHAAGSNTSTSIRRMANLLQVSSPFGRALEAVDRDAMARTLYPVLQTLKGQNRLPPAEVAAAIAACAEGYPFPTNLDRDPPVGGLAPKSQQVLMTEALEAGQSAEDFYAVLDDLRNKHETR